MKDPVMYAVMRNDLPSLNPGKLAAQTMHCGNAAVAAARRARNPLLRKWEKQSKQDFGTTLVFGAPKDFILSLPKSWHVYDDTYPCEIPREVAEVLQETAFWRWDAGWQIHLTPRRALFLRRELVGAYHLSDEMPQQIKNLELYP